MKPKHTALIAALALGTLSSVAVASDETRFEAHVRKFAAAGNEEKVNAGQMCICQTDDVDAANTMGYLV